MTMLMIAVGDIVDVSLAEGGFLNDFEVLSIPGNNEVYWELEDPSTTGIVVIGPTFIAMKKKWS